MSKFSVHLLYENGHSSCLSVKGCIEWKTKRAAIKHAKDMQTLIDKGRCFDGVIAVHVEDECGQIFEVGKHYAQN